MSRPKTCVVTGATSGIGRATALALAARGWRVILVGRNEKRAACLISKIKRRSNEPARFYRCDLSIFNEVRDLAARIRRDYDHLDVLINNAGARILEHGLTNEGIEKTLATNHLGHFVLTLSLIDSLAGAVGARIVNVSSGTHYSGSGVIENILFPRDYDGKKQYPDSKLANILFTYALAEKLAGTEISVNAVDPGEVATKFARNNGLIPWLKHRLYHLAKGQLVSPARGAKTIVFLASSADIDGVTGKFFRDMKERRSSDLSYDKAVQATLWEKSVALAGIDLDGPLAPHARTSVQAPE